MSTPAFLRSSLGESMGKSICYLNSGDNYWKCYCCPKGIFSSIWLENSSHRIERIYAWLYPVLALEFYQRVVVSIPGVMMQAKPDIKAWNLSVDVSEHHDALLSSINRHQSLIPLTSHHVISIGFSNHHSFPAQFLSEAYFFRHPPSNG